MLSKIYCWKKNKRKNKYILKKIYINILIYYNMLNEVDDLINILQLIQALKNANWSDEKILEFARTFYKIVQERVEDPDYIS